jgi:hypothetical protein
MSLPAFFFSGRGETEMDIVYVNRSKDSLFAVFNSGFEKAMRLAENHNFYVWRLEGETFIIQGSVYQSVNDLPFRDIRFSDWSRIKRALVSGVSCQDCAMYRDPCSGISDGIPDRRDPETLRRWGMSAIDELNEIGRREMWSRCPMTTDTIDCGRVTIRDEDLKALGFRVVTSHRLLLHSGGYYRSQEGRDQVMPKLSAAGLDEESDIEAIKSVVPDFESRGYGSQRWGRQMSLSDLQFDENLYQINRISARIRAAAGKETKSTTKSFKDRECSRCVYDCSKPPYDYRQKSSCAARQEDIVAGEVIDKSWMYGFVVGDRDSRGDWVLSGTGKKRQGIILGPSRSKAGAVTVVSTVPMYESLGDVSYDVVQNLHGLGQQTPEQWFDEYSQAHQCLDMRLVHWALRSVYGRREIFWYGAGRGKRNRVLSVSLAANGTIVFGVDTSNGQGARSPRFSFRLRYPYFEDIKNNLDMFPGSGRAR